MATPDPQLDPHRLDSLAAVRAIIGDESPATRTKLNDSLDEASRGFLARSPLALLATSDVLGRPDVTPRGDGPGFAVAPDDRTLLIPEQKGNRLIFALQSILANPRVALLFLVPGTEETLRIHGSAELTKDPAVLASLTQRARPALLAIRVHVELCFFQCAKAFRRSTLWDPTTWSEPLHISFGAMFAKEFGADAEFAAKIDASIQENYRTEL